MLSQIQLAKFVAKLRLIEHGLLVAAKQLDDFSPDSDIKKDEEGSEEEEAETAHDFEKRVNAFVNANLKRAPTSKRDNYKDGLVYQARKDIISEFLKAIVARKKCLNCDAYVVYLTCSNAR